MSELVDQNGMTDPGIAAGFGGGLGRNGYICGAVAAATMIIGLEGRGKSKKEIYAQVDGFLNDFKSRFGDVNCRGLISVDLKTKEGMDYLAAEGHKKCNAFVRYAADRIAEMIGKKE